MHTVASHSGEIFMKELKIGISLAHKLHSLLSFLLLLILPCLECRQFFFSISSYMSEQLTPFHSSRSFPFPSLLLSFLIVPIAKVVFFWGRYALKADITDKALKILI